MAMAITVPCDALCIRFVHICLMLLFLSMEFRVCTENRSGFGGQTEEPFELWHMIQTNSESFRITVILR